ncbi:MAG: methylmalonyl-CoA mutase [Acidobacteria bacterium]|nr:methylmalonyl-CoA mutase [Acidobacteriota bacterium]
MSNPPTKKPAPFQTASQIPVKSAYTQNDLRDFDARAQLGEPGAFPFTRGIYPDMYRGRVWTQRQYAGFGTAAESNRRYRYLLSQGQSALSVAFDLPTQMGLDSDHPLAVGEVGRVGVAICGLPDMETLFDGIPLDTISTSMTINSTAGILLALYVAVARKQGRDPHRLTGTVQNDILKEYIARGTHIYPPAPSLRLTTDLFAWAAREVPAWNVISVSGYHIREAGSTAVEELAFTLANAIAYLDAARTAGLDIDSIAPRVSFFFNCHNDFFEEIAKFRAARRLWAHIVRDQFGSANPRSQMLRFHTQTAGSTLTAQQPEMNVVRTTLQALAAVLGGTQSLHTNAQDEALGLPTESAARLALRTQQVIAAESNVISAVDPLAGSYFIESLTNEIALRASELLQQIAEMGGMLRAIESGFVQRKIQQSAFRQQRNLDSGEQQVVGVNCFQSDNKAALPVFQIDPRIEDNQIARLREMRARRNAQRAAEAIQAVEQTARTADNLMPAILAAVEAHATVGEISSGLRNVFGEYKEGVVW